MLDQLQGLLGKNPIFSGGLLLMLLGGLLAYVRRLPWQLWELLQRRVIVRLELSDSDSSFFWLQAWLSARLQDRRCGHWAVAAQCHGPVTAKPVTAKPVTEEPAVTFLLSPAPGWCFLWERRVPLWITRSRRELQGFNTRPFTESFHVVTTRSGKQIVLDALRAGERLLSPKPGKLQIWRAYGNSRELSHRVVAGNRVTDWRSQPGWRAVAGPNVPREPLAESLKSAISGRGRRTAPDRPPPFFWEQKMKTTPQKTTSQKHAELKHLAASAAKSIYTMLKLACEIIADHDYVDQFGGEAAVIERMEADEFAHFGGSPSLPEMIRAFRANPSHETWAEYRFNVWALIELSLPAKGEATVRTNWRAIAKEFEAKLAVAEATLAEFRASNAELRSRVDELVSANGELRGQLTATREFRRLAVA